jgi:CDP-diacylglycerol--inositol 3-phosphatidyltransferase
MADGYAARYFNQVSFFGTVLDYIIDRTETILYVTITSLMFPGLARLFHLILTLDIASHISRLYTTINHGEMHHKKLTSSFRLLNLYYSNRIILILSCFTYNAFFGYFGFKYVLHSTPEWLLIIFIITMPGFIFKNIVHVLQLLECFKNPLGENQSQFIKIV